MYLVRKRIIIHVRKNKCLLPTTASWHTWQ
jgi:hypothetical protein